MKQIFEMHGKWWSQMCTPVHPITCEKKCDMGLNASLVGVVSGPHHATSLYALLSILELPALQGKEIKITLEADLEEK